ncbi:hypothetical protein TRFO_15275 [Tritrichomonas foetus]|uniref:DUF3447 domain-containing protein n=1 Tax=Tritrichomonas foetus TaxID=1144522 RepID=A0A1J4KXC4_9EUKA|nr:hypothetical protein TRFO_15275 [Tritrichomonas foetus]|eukprot:OHT14358.1 hypothetical protein TRFO_15275 [Tritrichomonas foetus]
MNHGFVSVQSIKLHFESCFPRTWQYIHWVLPELLESYVPTWKSNLGNDDNSLFITFIKQLYKEGKEDNFDKFKQMRNSGDVPDPIFEVIKNDKIDTLQLIFSQSKESLNSEVPFNLFEKNQKLTLINYAAFYGSVKCFNFLFLNHADISQKTLAYAISNGNIEIIRTIYQHLESLDIHDCLDGLLQSVANHENDIFDWLFDEYKRKNPDFTFRRLISSAVKNNNSHVLIKCIEEGCELEYFSNYFISEIARKGCLKLYKFILKLCPKIYFDTQYEIKSYVQTDSLEIFTLFLDNCHNFGNVDIVEALKSSVKTHSFDIMRFICEKWKNNLYDYFELNPKDVDLLICSALGNNDNSNTDDAIIYLVDFLCDYEFDQSFIIACGNDKIEIVKYMCKLLLQKNPKYNFTSALIESGIGCAERVLKFLIQNIELVYDFEEVLSKSKEILSNGNENTLSLFMTIFTEEQKRLFLYDFGYHAIQSQNPELINFIINQNYNLQNALFSAIFYNSLDTVKLIIDKNNSPNFINGLTNHGTAITYAVLLNRIEIVKFLLTMPNINLIYSNPLETAIVQSNPEMTSILLHFCDKNINPYLPQINRSIQNMAKKIKKNSEAANNESNDLLSNNDILILKMLVKIKNIEINILINEKSFLQIACSMNHEELVSILLSCENIDVNCFNFLFLTTELDNYLHCIPYETSPLNIALKNHNNIIVELLLKHPQIEVNCSLAREGTPLMIAIENKNFIGVDLLLKHPDIDVNVGNENSTPLEEVIHLKQVNIIEMIINHKSFHPDENALFKAYSLCLILGMEEIAAQIFECPQFDINRIGKIHEINSLLLNNEYNCLSRKEVTPLIIAVITFNDLNIQKIIHHPKFDPNKSLIHLAIENSIEIDDVDIFRMLIPYCTSSLKSFLIYAAKTCSNNIIQYLWSESYNNDIQEEDIISAFLSSSHLNTLKLIYRLHPIDLSKQPPSPFKSYFQIIFKPENVIRSSNEVRSLVEFLIENGADPNSDLGNGLTPLAKAIINMKEETVEALLSFPQIDLNKRLEPTNHTYLHLAAQSSKTILSQILDINVIDVNSEDNNGETPLFYAVRKNIRENVDLLFQNPKLDYKKRNHQNFTVLEYSKPKYHKDDERYSFYSFSQRYTPITIPDDKEKNKYLQTIIHKLNAISRKISY